MVSDTVNIYYRYTENIKISVPSGSGCTVQTTDRSGTETKFLPGNTTQECTAFPLVSTHPTWAKEFGKDIPVIKVSTFTSGILE